MQPFIYQWSYVNSHQTYISNPNGEEDLEDFASRKFIMVEENDEVFPSSMLWNRLHGYFSSSPKTANLMKSLRMALNYCKVHRPVTLLVMTIFLPIDRNRKVLWVCCNQG